MLNKAIFWGTLVLIIGYMNMMILGKERHLCQARSCGPSFTDARRLYDLELRAFSGDLNCIRQKIRSKKRAHPQQSPAHGGQR